MHIAKQIGVNNNGYVPYCDYSRDYSPPLHSLNSLRTNNTSLKSHLIASSGHSNPSINPSNTTSSSVINMNNTPTSYMNGHLPIDHYSLGRHRQELRQDNGLPSIQMNTLPNGIISSMYSSGVKYRSKSIYYRNSFLDQSMLNNIDPRYSATYGNPFLRSTNPLPPLPPPSTANPAVTPAPPPYSKPPNTSNSSFSSSTTVSNHASLLGANYSNPSIISIAPTSTTPSQVTSPSRQFILPANGDLKKGSLATHV